MAFGTLGVWAEHVTQIWRIRRHGLRATIEPWDAKTVAIKDTARRTIAIAERDDRASYAAMTGIDWMRAEPLDRRPTQRELDELFDLQREANRAVVSYPDGVIRGDHEDSGVLSASAPIERQRF